MLNTEELHPEDLSSPIQKFFVTWMNPMIHLAAKRRLEESDVWNCPKDQTVEYYTNLLWKSWLNEIKEASEKHRHPSLPRAIVKTFQNDILFAGVFQVLFLGFQLGQPYLVGELVASLESTQPLSIGVGYAIGLGLVSLASSLCLTEAFFALRRLGVALRSGMMMAVYKHSLKLTSQARQQNTVGQLVNLLAIDSEKLFLAVQFFHFTWHGPVMGIIVMILLIFQVGYAPALVGMAWIFTLIPLQNYLAERIGKIRRVMVQHTDERVKLTNEVLQAIRVIKLYCWERPFEDRLMSVRVTEVDFLSTYLNASALLRELLFAAGPISALLIFTVAVYGLDQSLNVVQIFRVLAFVNVLRFPLNLLGQALKALSDGRVSIDRLNRFFLLPTLPPPPLQGKLEESVYISFNSATYSWDEDQDILTTHKKPVKTIPNKESSNDDDKSQIRIQAKSETVGLNIELVQADDVDERKEANVNTQDYMTSKVEEEFRLQNIDLKVLNGELVAIVGSVGSGKSSLISAMLGEIRKLDGEYKISGRVGYCPQIPWIQNINLRDNVLFGLNGDDECITAAYEKALDDAALRPDLAILPARDRTEIGERGINLSGGQKARVSIARVLLAACRCDIILMDDPFSALDGSTGNHIFQHGVKESLAGKLRVLALNSHLHLLPQFDRVIVLEKGRIVIDDKPAIVLRRLTYLVPEYTQADNKDKESTIAQQDTSKQPLDFSTTVKSQPESVSSITPTLQTKSVDSVPKAKGSDGKLMVTENRAVGAVSFNAYLKYFGGAFYSNDIPADTASNEQPAMKRGFAYLVLLLVIFSIAQIARVAIDLYLARWAEEGGRKTSVLASDYYISFGVLIALLCVRSFYLNIFSVMSSAKIHRRVFRKVLTASVPMFFDTHTVGEVLNRFSKDTETMDSSVPEFLLQVLINWLQVLSVFGLCLWATPYFVIVLVPLGIAFVGLFNYFSCISRDLKRLESVTRSPVYSAFSETLTGLQTIRAFGDTERFHQRYLKILERNHKFFFHLWLAQCWMTARLEAATSFILFAIALLAICIRGSVSQITLGLSLSYGLQLTALFQRCVQVSIDVATYMTSTERVLEYLDEPSEEVTLPKNHLLIESNPQNDSNRSQQLVKLDDINQNIYKDIGRWEELTLDEQRTWPSQGKLELREVWMRYRNNDSVLRGISFATRPGERIGVCGRTGAGKSSLLVALFRVAEVHKGLIAIDGVDISSVPLATLRSRLAIIPQDPVLFTGDLRFQLDPFQLYTDQEIWGVLGQVNLTELVQSLPRKLAEPIYENGGNLSQGQRQLLCIGRALLRRASILVVDEGTSAVDPQTDDLIQKTLREGAKANNTTVLAIAHRLQTILDFDRILVMGEGKVLEFDTPQSLIANSESHFASMLKTHM